MRLIWDSAIEALSEEDGEFGFGHVKPASVLWGVVPFEPFRETRFLGEIPSRPDSVARLVERLSKKYAKLAFCYEAEPCGYGLYRQIVALGHECVVVAPSLVPTRP